MVGPDPKAGWKPGAAQPMLKLRATLLGEIRAFMRARGVLEVETPVLSRAGNSDPGIEQFSLHDAARYLRTSPEYAMKRLLAAGSGDIFELGRVFRAGEQGRFHNPEFTLLEWYRCDWSYQRLMDEVTALVRHCLPGFELAESRVSYRALLQTHANIDHVTASDKDLAARVRECGYDGPALDRNGMLDLLVTHLAQPQLPEHGLTLVYDYPPDQAALARIRPGPVPVAERFEVFLGRIELANGYQELTDAEEQRQRFASEATLRAERDQSRAPLDERLLAALSAGLPECSGVALGVDRLLMHRAGAASLDEVMAFSANRA
ncbi:MAG: EF-P lysine aminoacylase GenX [Xanthomonadales bacterium]|nr:EF-P lysine aminoacylase GenX [Xanthomonadales bacterium]